MPPTNCPLNGDQLKHEGKLPEVVREAALNTDAPQIEVTTRIGTINPDLTVGVDITAAVPLKANDAVCSPGVKLHGAGFIVTPQQAEYLGLGKRPGLERHVRPYRNGKDLTGHSRNVMVIDLFGLDETTVRQRFPEVYQHLLEKVKPERDRNNEEYRRINWWLFGRKNSLMRGFTADLSRYIVTVETMKHRIFQFLDGSICPDNKLIAIGSDDASVLGVLSSRIHVVWATRAGGWLGVGNDPVYVKSRCFDPFPFPNARAEHREAIGAIAEELDALRAQRLAGHPHLTLTGLYNVLERLRGGTVPEALSAAERVIFDDGLVLVLKELHDRLDVAVADAYGWPVDLAEEEVLRRLLALNRERATEEAAGTVRWLRPDYQIPYFGAAAPQSEQYEADLGETASKQQKPAFPNDSAEQTAEVLKLLIDSGEPLDVAGIAARFRQTKHTKPAIESIVRALVRVGLLSQDETGRYSASRG